MALTQVQGGMVASGTITSNNVSFAANSISGSALTANTVSNTAFQTGSVENYMSAQGFGIGMRNRIINGAMMIDQRNAGAALSFASGPAGIYTLDRWSFGYSQNSKITAQQNQGSATPPAGFSNYLGFTSASSYSVGSSDYFLLTQPIEGLNVSDLAWGTSNAKTVTLSFQVYSSLTGTFGGSLRNSAANRSYPFSYSVSSANTWTTISVTIPGDTSGTWLTTNGIGVNVGFTLGSGSSFLGSSGAWAGANYHGPTGATSVVGTNGATFYITGVQLEKGSVATPFEYRQYGTELALCQRYYYRGIIWSVGAGDLTNLYTAFFSLPVTMRTQPSVTNGADSSGIQCAGTLYNVTAATAVIYNTWWSGASMAVSVTTNAQIPRWNVAAGRLPDLQANAEL